MPSSQSAHPVYCASEEAIAAAALAHGLPLDPDKLTDALIAAHHPDLGLDRSVCLRDVVEALRTGGEEHMYALECRGGLGEAMADYLAAEFGGSR